MKKLILLPIIGMMTAMMFSSCNKDENPGNSFKVRMTDAPGDYAGLTVQITGIDIYHETQGWINLSSETQFVNVTDLTNGNEIELANNTNVQAGLYTKVKITFGGQNSLNLTGDFNGAGSDLSVDLVWNGSQEVVIDINQQVTADAGANILLDFHVAESIIEQVNTFLIHPVISVIHDEATGVRGQVQGTVMAAIIITNGQSTYSSYIDASGNFLIRGLQPGTYDVTILPSQFNEVGQSPQETQINNVVITEGEINNMGSIQL